MLVKASSQALFCKPIRQRPEPTGLTLYLDQTSTIRGFITGAANYRGKVAGYQQKAPEKAEVID
ncbi:MAG: hypothetical protein AseanaTS_12150 [Candidatus Pelagadaptatus aseana]